MRKLIVFPTCLAIVLVASAAWAQTKTTAPTQGTTLTQAAPTSQAPGSTSSATQGAYQKLSPGNQKIAKALYDAQQSKTSSLDQIATMKQHKGWGEIFKEMKASGQIPPAVKNLGELVSKSHAQSGKSDDTTVTSASGKSQEAGSKSGKGHSEGDSSEAGASGRPSGLGSHGGGRGR